MISELNRELYAATTGVPLYHYTSLAGVKGIIDTGLLRATEITYLNDSTEMAHTVSQLDPETWFREGFGKLESKLFVQFREWISHRLTAGHKLYVGCFTANGNLLSQWRSYCPPTRGVNLGFNGAKLTASACDQGWKLGKCIYEQDKKEEIAIEVLNEIEDLAERKGAKAGSFQHIFEELETHLLEIAALLKHPAFHEEQEWRIVSPVITNYVEADIEYREGASMLIPFMKFGLPHAPDRRVDLEHVYLGPTPNSNISMESLSNYLSKFGASPRNGVQYSNVPYRTW
ncbi:DUF2971 domain-containing protein [Nitrospira japonica]|nr:DUF2971 domain-containing protein [Nitrospira japonica]